MLKMANKALLYGECEKLAPDGTAVNSVHCDNVVITSCVEAGCAVYHWSMLRVVSFTLQHQPMARQYDTMTFS